MVYELAADGTYSVLHSFAGRDGTNPTSLVLDAAGNLYGTAGSGGPGSSGLVFKLNSKGGFSIIDSFSGDDFSPRGLVRDDAGTLYCHTAGGASGAGSVFRLAPNNTRVLLHAFNGGDGQYPSGLALDRHGTLYGTMYGGGAANYGVLYRIGPDGAFAVLHNFARFTAGLGKPSEDGGNPSGGLIVDAAGVVYGTTELGGASDWGVIFQFIPSATP